MSRDSGAEEAVVCEYCGINLEALRVRLPLLWGKRFMRMLFV